MSGRAPGSITPYRDRGRRSVGLGSLVRPAAVPALLALQEALGDVTPPCATDPDSWFANGPAEAQPAIEGCGYCPAVTECEAFALAGRERFGVWGARYFGPNRKDEALPVRASRPYRREDVAS